MQQTGLNEAYKLSELDIKNYSGVKARIGAVLEELLEKTQINEEINF